MDFRPTQDRVLIRPELGDTETVAGILLATPTEAPPEGVVVAVGPDVTGIEVGDNVAFSKYGGSYLTIDDVDYLILAEKEVLGRF